MPENNSHTDPNEVDIELQQAFHELAEKKAHEELLLHPNQLLPQKALVERYKSELETEFAKNKKRQANGAFKIGGALEELSTENPNLLTDEILDGIDRIACLSETIAKDTEHFTEILEQGGSLQNLAQANDTVVDALYQAAKRLYEQKLFDDAADAFLFLTGLNPNKYAFWLGLGNAEYHRKEYKAALVAYTVLCNMTPQDPSLRLTQSQCHEALGDLQNALNALEEAMTCLREDELLASWETRLEQEKARLEKLQHN